MHDFEKKIYIAMLIGLIVFAAIAVKSYYQNEVKFETAIELIEDAQYSVVIDGFIAEPHNYDIKGFSSKFYYVVEIDYENKKVYLATRRK